MDVYGCDVGIDIDCEASETNSDLYPAGIVSQLSSNSGGTVTVTGCTVTGTITSGGKYAASLVGIVQGKATVENCLSDVVIQSTVDGDGTHGGLVGVTASNSTTLINGCVFCGKLLTVGENDTGNCGGILGWKNANVTIKNCLYAPAALGDGEREVAAGSGDYPSATFYRGNEPTITNCYYTRTLGVAQAKQAHSVTADENVTLALSGSAAAYQAYDVSGLSTYGTGLAYNGGIYAANGEELSLSLGCEVPESYSFRGYTVDAGSLSGAQNPYLLTMPDADVRVSASLVRLYTVTVSDSIANGSVTADVTKAAEGETVTLTVVPAEGCRLDSLTRVTGDEDHFTEITEQDENGNYIFTMPAGDVTVTAHFSRVYTITVLEGITNGRLTASVAEAAEGETVTLTAVPASGYRLVSLTSVTDGADQPVAITEQDEDGNYLFSMLAGNVTITASFKRVYTITIRSGIQNGTVTANVLEAVQGETVTLTATPDEGFELVANGLLVENQSANIYLAVKNNKFSMPAANVVVTAGFLPAAKQVRYIDGSGAEQTATAYPLVENSATLPGGWYVAEGDINLQEALYFLGNKDANLILADGVPYGDPMIWSAEGYVRSVREGGNASETTLELMNAMLKYVDSAKIVFEQ